MKLNHLDLQVVDVQATARFFEAFFAFEMQSNRASPAIAILRGSDGFVLIVQRCKSDVAAYPEGFHVGFLVASEGAVVAFHERARREGLAISDVDRNQRGVLTYCRAPGDILVEVSWHRPKPSPTPAG